MGTRPSRKPARRPGGGAVIEPRLYRLAFVPAVLLLVVAMFSLASRPRPLPQGLAADVLFDGRLAEVGASGIATRHPGRAPGSAGDRAVAAQVARTFSAQGFRVERVRFDHAGRQLENVLARRAGRSRRQIAIVAARDSLRRPDATGSAADTAALLELGRVFRGRPSRKTLVLASVDGSTLGEVGTRRLLRDLGPPSLMDGVIVISNLGARRREGPLVQAWSNGHGRAGIGLQRTAAESIRQELEVSIGASGVLGQLVRLSFPLGIGSQGPLLEGGYDAVRISGSGELPLSGSSPPEEIDRDRLGGLGRATLRTFTALDAAGRPPDRGPRAYLTAGSRVLPGWVLWLLSAALLLPALLASVDAFARARRRKLALLPGLHRVAVWCAPPLAALAVAELLALAGATPTPPPAPPAPLWVPFNGAAAGVLAGVLAAMPIAWLVARSVAPRHGGEEGEGPEPAAGVVVALALSATALVAWVVNPYAGLIWAAPLNLWVLAVLAGPPLTRRARFVLIALGALPPLLAAAYYLFALSLDPLAGAWYLLLLIVGDHVSLLSSLLACVLLGSLGAALALTRAHAAPEADPAPPAAPLFGPGSYAGPGSLGGTESALRR